MSGLFSGLSFWVVGTPEEVENTNTIIKNQDGVIATSINFAKYAIVFKPPLDDDELQEKAHTELRKREQRRKSFGAESVSVEARWLQACLYQNAVIFPDEYEVGTNTLLDDAFWLRYVDLHRRQNKEPPMIHRLKEEVNVYVVSDEEEEEVVVSRSKGLKRGPPDDHHTCNRSLAHRRMRSRLAVNAGTSSKNTSHQAYSALGLSGSGDEVDKVQNLSRPNDAAIGEDSDKDFDDNAEEDTDIDYNNAMPSVYALRANAKGTSLCSRWKRPAGRRDRDSMPIDGLPLAHGPAGSKARTALSSGEPLDSVKNNTASKPRSPRFNFLDVRPKDQASYDNMIRKLTAIMVTGLPEGGLSTYLRNNKMRKYYERYRSLTLQNVPSLLTIPKVAAWAEKSGCL